MSALTPITYYENAENHGSYQYVSIEEIVNNFMDNYLGDDTILGNIERDKVIYQARQGIKRFTIGGLREVKVIELEMNETLDVILPYNYLEYVRISWVNKYSGQIMPMAENRHTPLGVAHLQDNNANILFDNNGDILIGTTALETINDTLTNYAVVNPNTPLLDSWFEGSRYDYQQSWSLDTSKNGNGTFNIDRNAGRIHFSSENLTRIILLEYISDGLEANNDADIKINKLAEDALYAFIHNELVKPSIRVADYEKRRIKKEFDTLWRNAKLRTQRIKIQEFIQIFKQGKTWLR